jgi:hypothetical protein
MRFESSVTSVWWIPSESVSGLYKAGFAVGASHPDAPPPDVVKDLAGLDELFAAQRFRFANHLAAWIEVQDGHIVDAGYSGRGYISRTRFGWGPQRGGDVPAHAVPRPQDRPRELDNRAATKTAPCTGRANPLCGPDQASHAMVRLLGSVWGRTCASEPR